MSKPGRLKVIEQFLADGNARVPIKRGRQLRILIQNELRNGFCNMPPDAVLKEQPQYDRANT